MQIYNTFIPQTCAKNRNTLVWIVSCIFLCFLLLSVYFYRTWRIQKHKDKSTYYFTYNSLSSCSVMNFVYRMQTKTYSSCPQNRQDWAGINYRMFRRFLWGWNLVSRVSGIKWFDGVREQGAKENIYWDTREW